MRLPPTILLIASLSVTLWSPIAADVCFIVYQMADNDLEYFIRQDNYELIQSDGIRDPTVTTWVYFDGRNYGNFEQDIFEPLQEVYDEDGVTPLTQKYEGSRYMYWDHSFGKMIIATSLPGEQNGDDPQTVSDFATTALTDCVAKGSNEFFFAFSSHGGGFSGFGGDENTGRRLTQLNQDIASAIAEALASVDGAPDQLDVLGFDACLMQAVGAVDDYKDITKYFLASEAVEPGHGWAYDFLSDTGSALDMAKNIVNEFADQTQGDFHRTPKTLTIVDTYLFTVFLDAWEALSFELKFLLDANNDADLFAFLGRARAEAIAFQSSTDDRETKTPSGMDIGSFLEAFQNLCVPNSDSQLALLMDEVQLAYNDMIVLHRNGPGTVPSTGMSILWPFRSEYDMYTSYYDGILFDDTAASATTDAPNWQDFLQTFLNSVTPFGVDSVCGSGAESELVPTSDGQLLLNPSAEFTDSGFSYTVKTEITQNTDFVYVESGVDLSDFLGDADRRNRILGSNAFKSITSSYNTTRRSRRKGRRTKRHMSRRAQDDEDYFILFGGDVQGFYEKSSYTAVWDFSNFAVSDGDQIELAYAFDDGYGSRSIPVMYYPPSIELTADDILFGTTFDAALDLGGFDGELTFYRDSNSGAVDQVVLFTYDSSGALSETPRRALGSIVPILYAEIFLDGSYRDGTLVGGSGPSIFKWGPDSLLQVIEYDAYEFAQQLGAKSLTVDLSAYDFDVDFDAVGAEDKKYFYIDVDDATVSPEPTYIFAPTKAPIVSPTDPPVENTEAPVAPTISPTEPPVETTEAPAVSPTDPAEATTEAPVSSPTDPPIGSTGTPVPSPTDMDSPDDILNFSAGLVSFGGSLFAVVGICLFGNIINL